MGEAPYNPVPKTVPFIDVVACRHSIRLAFLAAGQVVVASLPYPLVTHACVLKNCYFRIHTLCHTHCRVRGWPALVRIYHVERTVEL